MKSWLRRLRTLFTLDGFAVAPILHQQVVVMLAAAGVVVVFIPLIGSFDDSYAVFMQTKELSELPVWIIPLALIELVLGIMIMSFVISLISSALNQFIDGIKKGTLGYTRSRHFVLININDMMADILGEINDRAISSNAIYDVVILVADSDQVAKARELLDGNSFPCLQIYVRQGDTYNQETYRRINLCGATGVLLLRDGAEPDPFAADNNALKILFVLAGWKDFTATLARRLAEKSPVKFIVEMSNTIASSDIAARLASNNGNRSFIVVHPPEIADRLLGRSIIDVSYYRIFEELFSFTGKEIYFVNPLKVNGGSSMAGLSFKQACFGLHRGVLIGLCRFKQGVFETLICPMEETILAGDWLIVVAEDERAADFDPARKLTASQNTLPQPEEIVRRRILMLGNEHAFPSITEFLDATSLQIYNENITIFTQPEDYFQPALIARIKSDEFDNIVINLKDELGFRLAAHLTASLPPGDPFLDKIVTILNSPATDEILNSGRDQRSTILSGRICAKYLTQVLFQKSLEAVIRDLCSAEGYELNLLAVGTQFPRSALGTKDEVKQLLLNSGMAYLGYMDLQKNVQLDGEDFSQATTIIVLAKGKL
ncbi:MAG: hypothetical protein NTU80_04040 [Verrucomicrobia bacterium]|nr:hypothetical protein [Verrucomicrobiota bacterium]